MKKSDFGYFCYSVAQTSSHRNQREVKEKGQEIKTNNRQNSRPPVCVLVWVRNVSSSERWPDRCGHVERDVVL